MAPTIAKSGPGRKKKSATPAEPTRRSTRAVVPRTIFSSSGVTKPKAAPKKRKTTVKDKVVGVAKKVKGTVTKKPATKAAGTKKLKGTDGKGVKKTKTKV